MYFTKSNEIEQDYEIIIPWNFIFQDKSNKTWSNKVNVNNISNIMASKRLEGASTITQQVAKNFLLTNEVSLNRKITEAILAFRIERALSQERILELYLNQIYLGS